MKQKTKKNSKAFTLIEIMIAIAIVGILASAVMVSTKGYGVKARSAKAQSEMAAVVPNMISCWGNGGKVQKPDSAGENDICTGITGALNYGQWPSFTGDLDSYDFAVASTPTAAVADTSDYCAAGCIDRDTWYVWVDSSSSDDDRRICCSKVGGGCASTIKASGTTCNGTSANWVD